MGGNQFILFLMQILPLWQSVKKGKLQSFPESLPGCCLLKEPKKLACKAVISRLVPKADLQRDLETWKEERKDMVGDKCMLG